VRLVNIWNSLPNEVVEADTVNALKYGLDKHWFKLTKKYFSILTPT